MNREIKFRAWDKANTQEMFRTVLAIDWYNDEIKIEHNSGMIEDEKLSDFVLMQYTCLKDKNGVEIYEGDIYKYKHRFDSERYEYRHSVVKWSETDIAYEGTFHGYELNESHIEVVGNIYENPELLKER